MFLNRFFAQNTAICSFIAKIRRLLAILISTLDNLKYDKQTIALFVVASLSLYMVIY